MDCRALAETQSLLHASYKMHEKERMEFLAFRLKERQELAAEKDTVGTERETLKKERLEFAARQVRARQSPAFVWSAIETGRQAVEKDQEKLVTVSKLLDDERMLYRAATKQAQRKSKHSIKWVRNSGDHLQVAWRLCRMVSGVSSSSYFYSCRA